MSGPDVSRRPFLQAPRPLAFAHRGGSLLWPENTMLAFRGAVEMGYRYLETDLHATRDGVLVLIHDDTLERTTDGSGPVWEHTLADDQPDGRDPRPRATLAALNDTCHLGGM